MFLVLGAASLISVTQGFLNALTLSQDFQWSPSVLFWSGENPFAESLNGNPEGKIILNQEPNYLHALYIMLFPFALQAFGAAKWSWALINLALTLICLLLIRKIYHLSNTQLFVVGALLLISTPFRNALGNGQQALLVLAFMLAYWRATGRAKGVFLSAAIVKYSFAPVFLIRSLLRREAAIITAGLVTVCAILFFAWQVGDFSFELLMGPVLVAEKKTSPGLADLMSLMRYNLGFSMAVAAAISITLSAFVAFALRNRDNDGLSLAVACTASLLLFQHQGYDYVFLLPVVALVGASQSGFSIAARVVLSVTVAYFFFFCKINDLALHLPELYVRVIGACLLASSLGTLLYQMRVRGTALTSEPAPHGKLGRHRADVSPF